MKKLNVDLKPKRKVVKIASKPHKPAEAEAERVNKQHHVSFITTLT